jgi:RNA recognition motif-containing protein
MQQHAEAENALEGLNNSLMRGRPIRVGWARRNSSCLYIEGLCPSVTAEDLNTAFMPFGELEQSKTTVTPSGNTDMNNGTVHFTFRDSAMLAKGRMNGQVLGQLPIVVEWGQLPSSSDRYGGGGGGNGGYTRNNSGYPFHSKVYNSHGHDHGHGYGRGHVHGHGHMERGIGNQELYMTYEELGPAAPAVSLYVNFHSVAPGIDITEEVAVTQASPSRSIPTFLPLSSAQNSLTPSLPLTLPPSPTHALALVGDFQPVCTVYQPSLRAHQVMHGRHGLT